MEETGLVSKYLTVFWNYNRKNNEYISKLIELAHNINIICNKVHIAKSNNFIEMTTKYDEIINNIEGLDKCLHTLLNNQTYVKYKQYEYIFIENCNEIYIELCKNIKFKIDKNSFINFMLNNTCEGRVILQNKYAINDLDILFMMYNNRIKYITNNNIDNNTNNNTDNDIDIDINDQDITNNNINT